jgi:hypothetical protein
MDSRLRGNDGAHPPGQVDGAAFSKIEKTPQLSLTGFFVFGVYAGSIYFR